MGLTAAAATTISAGIGALASVGTSVANAGATQLAREENYKYNEQLARNADARARKLYTDFESPEAKMQQIKAAGLSPSVMYSEGQGGAGGTIPQGAQGGNPTTAAPQYSLEYAMQAAMLGAQLKNIEADTKLKEAEAGKTGEETTLLGIIQERTREEIKNIIANTKNEEEKATLTQLQQVAQIFQNQITAESADAQIESMRNNATMLHNLAEKYAQEALNEYREGQITKATMLDRIKQVELQNKALAAQIVCTKADAELKKANIKLTNKQWDKLANDILIDNRLIQVKEGQLQVDRDKLEEQVKQWCKENELTERGQDIQIAKIIADYISNDKMFLAKLVDSIIPL